MHRNSSDLPFVIAELARLSKHSERLINPLRFLAQKDIRPMITYCIRGYVYSCTGTVGYVLDLARSSTAYGCPVYCILVQSAVPVSVPVVLWEYGLLRTSHFASHIRPYRYRYRYSQYWSNRSTRMSALALRRCYGSRLVIAHCSVCSLDRAWCSR